MFDAKIIRDDPAAFDVARAKRGLPPIAEEIIRLDGVVRAAISKLQAIQEQRNKVSKDIGAAKGRGEDADHLIAEVATLKDDNRRAEDEQREASASLQVMLTGEPVVKTTRDQAAPGDRLILDEEKNQLRGAIESLTEPHRLVLELAIYQEMPYAEISSVIKIPIGTVKSRMHNCVRALRTHMADQKEHEADQASFRFPRRARGSAG